MANMLISKKLRPSISFKPRYFSSKSFLFLFCFLQGFFGFNGLRSWAGMNKDIQAAQAAIDMGLPTLAQTYLENYLLAPLPQANKVHENLALVFLIKGDFNNMKRAQNLAQHSSQSLVIDSILQWQQKQKLYLWPLLCHNSTEFSQNAYTQAWYFLAKAVCAYPINSPKWAACFSEIQPLMSAQTFQQLQEIAIEMKIIAGEQWIGNNTSINSQQNYSYLRILFLQKKWALMDDLIQKQINNLQLSSEQKLPFYLWLVRIQLAQGKDLDNILLETLQCVHEDSSLVDFLIQSWLNSIQNETVMSRIQSLQKLSKRYHWNQKKHFFTLLKIQNYINNNQPNKAISLLEKLLKKATDDSTKKQIHLLFAKAYFCLGEAYYSLSADSLAEAQKLNQQQTDQSLHILQADLRLLSKDYDRAYYTYQGLLTLPLNHNTLEELAYKWVLCGIFCEASQQEIEQQFDFCKELHILNNRQKTQLQVLYAQHLFDKQAYHEAFSYTKNIPLQNLDNAWRNDLYLLQAKLLFNLQEINEALNYFKLLKKQNLSLEKKAECHIYRGRIYVCKNLYEKAEKDFLWVQKYAQLPLDIQAQAVFSLADLYALERAYIKAQQILVNFADKNPNFSWSPLAYYQAAIHCEKRGLVYAQTTIDLLQTICLQYPNHPLCFQARLKQGTLLMNLNQFEAAKRIFEELQTNNNVTFNIFCRFLKIKCDIALHSILPLQACQQLQGLLQEDLPLELRLEVVLQLAIAYKNVQDINQAQKLLWTECYPLLCDSKNSFNDKVAYWLTQCLLTLAQLSHDKNIANQIYTLMLEANLPYSHLIKPYTK